MKESKEPSKQLQKSCETGVVRFVIIEKLPEDISDFKMHMLEKLYIYDFCQRGGYNVCNHEAERIENLKDLLLYELLYYSDVYKKMNTAFKSEYGINIWDMRSRTQRNRNT